MTRRLVTVALFGLIGVAILLLLGSWQVQRLAWKQDMIAAIEARLDQPPAPLPAAPDPVRDRYLRVAVQGDFADGALFVLGSARRWGPGFRVVAPFVTTDGRRILVDRGFVPEAERAAFEAGGPIAAPGKEIVGGLHWPRETDGYTPAPDRASNLWFARDVALMSEALATEPVLVVAETRPASGEFPVPQPLTVNLPDSHLQYAITWFSLAVAWAGMSIALAIRVRRGG